jgi:hypothetical protein
VAPPIANTVTARAPPVRARLSVATGLKRPTRFFSERIKEDIEVKEEDEHVMDLETDLDDVLQNYEEAIVVIVSPPCFALEVPYLTQLTSISTVREQKLVQQSIFI